MPRSPLQCLLGLKVQGRSQPHARSHDATPCRGHVAARSPGPRAWGRARHRTSRRCARHDVSGAGVADAPELARRRARRSRRRAPRGGEDAGRVEPPAAARRGAPRSAGRGVVVPGRVDVVGLGAEAQEGPHRQSPSRAAPAARRASSRSSGRHRRGRELDVGAQQVGQLGVASIPPRESTKRHHGTFIATYLSRVLLDACRPRGRSPTA
jgi:hypothetical protein